MVGIHHLLALIGRDSNHANIVALLRHETILSEIETVVHFSVHVVIDLTVFTVKQLQPFGSLVATIVIKAAHPAHQWVFHVPLVHGNENILLAVKGKFGQPVAKRLTVIRQQILVQDDGHRIRIVHTRFLFGSGKLTHIQHV